jgi:hypothetical protein
VLCVFARARDEISHLQQIAQRLLAGAVVVLEERVLTKRTRQVSFDPLHVLALALQHRLFHASQPSSADQCVHTKDREAASSRLECADLIAPGAVRHAKLGGTGQALPRLAAQRVWNALEC